MNIFDGFSSVCVEFRVCLYSMCVDKCKHLPLCAHKEIPSSFFLFCFCDLNCADLRGMTVLEEVQVVL